MFTVVWNVKVKFNYHFRLFIISMLEIKVNPPSQMHYNCNLEIIPMLGFNFIMFHEWVIFSKVYVGNKNIWRSVCHASSILTILPINKKVVEHKLFQFWPHETLKLKRLSMHVLQTNHNFWFSCFCVFSKYLLEAFPMQHWRMIWIILHGAEIQEFQTTISTFAFHTL
jgi:hypothetical protein